MGRLLESKTAQFIVDTSSVLLLSKMTLKATLHTHPTLATLLLDTFLLHALLFSHHPGAYTSPNNSSTEISQSLTF